MKVGVFSTIFEAFKFCWKHRTQFYLLALPAVVIMAILSTVLNALQPQEVQHTLEFESSSQQAHFFESSINYFYSGLPWRVLPAFLLLIPTIFLFTLYSVAWHRFYLKPKEDVTILNYYIWKNRHWQFLWSNLKILLLMLPIALIAVLITLASALLAPLIGFVMILFVIINYARFSMWLPASALDERLSFHRVLVLTRRNGGRLAAIIIITGCLVGILDGVVTALIAYASMPLDVIGDLTQDLLSKLAIYFIIYAGTAIGITALSVSYKQLTEG